MGIKYEITGFELKHKNEPSSVYFEVEFFPKSLDKFGINKRIITINLNLQDILLFNISSELRRQAMNLLNKSYSTNWWKEALNLSRLFNKEFYHETIELVKH